MRSSESHHSYYYNYYCYSLSIFFRHFPGGPVLADTRISPFWILLELRMMAVVVITGAITSSCLQVGCPSCRQQLLLLLLVLQKNQ